MRTLIVICFLLVTFQAYAFPPGFIAAVTSGRSTNYDITNWNAGTFESWKWDEAETTDPLGTLEAPPGTSSMFTVGAYSYRSRAIQAATYDWLRKTYTLASGTLSLYAWPLSSLDYVAVYIDGTLINEQLVPTATTWNLMTWPISDTGLHRVDIRMRSTSSSRIWLDDIKVPVPLP